MEVGELDFAFAFWSLHPNDCLKGSQGDAHVARVGGDALVALAKDGMDTIKSVERAATAAWIAFVALRKGRVVKIVTAGALQKIAAYCGHVAELRAGPGEERFAQNRVA